MPIMRARGRGRSRSTTISYTQTVRPGDSAAAMVHGRIRAGQPAGFGVVELYRDGNVRVMAQAIISDNRLPALLHMLPESTHRAIKDTATDLRDDIQSRLNAPSNAGVVYYSGTRPSPHQASAPGEEPVTWKGDIVSSLRVEEVRKGWFEVSVQGPHVASLEFGRVDGSIAPRPFMRPAGRDIIPHLERRIEGLVAEFERNFGRGSFIRLAGRSPTTGLAV